jgi:uncharacterized protein YraI
MRSKRYAGISSSFLKHSGPEISRTSIAQPHQAGTVTCVGAAIFGQRIQMKTVLLLSTVLVLGSASAQAAPRGYATHPVEIFAGPGQYPEVARLYSGAPLFVFGCVEDRSWCDVATRHDRGWISADVLEIQRRHHRLPLTDGRIELPTVSFDLGEYWAAITANGTFTANVTAIWRTAMNCGTGPNNGLAQISTVWTPPRP